MPVRCTNCGAENREVAKFCKVCGKPVMPTGAIICPRCQRANVPGAARCAYCSNPLTPAAASPTPAPASAPARSFGQLAPNIMLYNRYSVARLIGIGGMSAVYEGSDSRLGNRRVAIKEMSVVGAEPAEQQQIAAQFKQEAEMLAHLNHSNLPRVTDYFAETGKQYLVMDFVEGQSLQKILEGRHAPLPEATVVGWTLQLCEVLQYLHSRTPPVIFRDLKPSNIMLEPDGKIKLIDFGIARVYKPGKAHDTSSFGTSGYAPPEQYGKGQTDARSDTYALCVTAYNLLTTYDPARTPFSLPPVQHLNPTVSARLAQILKKGMSLDPNERWQSMAELRQALQTDGQRPAPSPPPVPRPAAPASTAPAPRPPAPPTTHLLRMMAQLSTGQLVAALGGFLVIAMLFLALFAQSMARTPFLWNNVDAFALVAPLAYAMSRRRGVAFASQVAFGFVGGLIVLGNVNSHGSSPGLLLLAAVLSGLFIDLWLVPLARWVPKPQSQRWWVEVIWLMGMASIATPLSHAIAYGVEYSGVAVWFTSALFGAVGWFAGDTIRQFVKMRKTGFKS